jgi:hypothetical protein
MTINLFNTNLYRSLYPDLAAAGLTTDAQLRSHFLNFGANEGRTFSQFISLSYYRSSNLDLGAAGLTTNRQLFEHLENFGAKEARRASIAFNPAFYKSRNQDLVAVGLNDEQLFQHYENFGLSEGRVASEYFNPRFYLDFNADLKAAFGNDYGRALRHYITFGIREGRVASAPVSPVTDPGSSLQTAYNMGNLLGKATLSDFVGATDQDDFYRFFLDSPSNINLALSGLTDATSLRLFVDLNQNSQIEAGEELSISSGTAASPPSISKTLGPGLYYVDVVTGSSFSNTLYNLSFAQTSAPRTTPSEPGSSQAAALDVGLLNTNRTFTDFVGSTDRQDFYKFVLDNFSNNFTMSLGGTTESVFATLYVDTNGNGGPEPNEVLATINATGSPTPVAINRNLPSGTYYLAVFTNSLTANSNYTLNLSV